ncbi:MULTISPECIES: hypothetical protein [Burkholderia]|uniref:Uncharacterized protein n=1 Tax=Burkholderia humptydooensis TaxID=430531 RepID=A0A7T2X2D2_9BURK|nr:MULTISPECIES: hypothetical protein [Burkholderia]QPS48055.1 hypothetical protein I6G56_27155 [Burkholderia humptydooensis]
MAAIIAPATAIAISIILASTLNMVIPRETETGRTHPVDVHPIQTLHAVIEPGRKFLPQAHKYF